MSDVPLDIEKAAIRLVNRYYGSEDVPLRALVEEALVAERNRCANVAIAIDSGRGNERFIAAAIHASSPTR